MPVKNNGKTSLTGHLKTQYDESERPLTILLTG